eukprot:COSAG02_NODE_30047_length_558_cov_0.895425_1_plen_73_part_01
MHHPTSLRQVSLTLDSYASLRFCGQIFVQWGRAYRILRVGWAQVLCGNRRKHHGESREGGKEEAHRGKKATLG